MVRIALLLICSLVLPLSAHAESPGDLVFDSTIEVSAASATSDAPPQIITEGQFEMESIATRSPSSVCAADERAPNAGGASHAYIIGGPEAQHVQIQHGPRLAPDLLAILKDRMSAFQDGPFVCLENACALQSTQEARQHLGRRVAARMSQGVLGGSQSHTPA